MVSSELLKISSLKMQATIIEKSQASAVCLMEVSYLDITGGWGFFG